MWHFITNFIKRYWPRDYKNKYIPLNVGGNSQDILFYNETSPYRSTILEKMLKALPQKVLHYGSFDILVK